MKTLFVLFFCVFFTLFIFAQQKEKTVPSTVKEVTVFLNGAQLTNLAEVSLPEGKSILKFVKLSPFIQAHTIQVRANKEITVLSVHHQNNWEAKENSEEFQQLKNKLDLIQKDLRIENVSLETAKEEMAFLTENKKINASNQTLTVTTLSAVESYFATQVKSLKLKQIESESRTKELVKKEQEVQRQLDSFSQHSRESGEVIVTIDAPQNKVYSFAITYSVLNASWYPSYDIRVDDITKPVTLVYKANIIQNTNVDWKDVKLTVSSSDPTLSITAPILYPYFLEEPKIQSRSFAKMASPDMAADVAVEADNMSVAMSAAVDPMIGEMETRTTTTAVNFAIQTPYSIVSSEKYTIDLARYQLPATYMYYAVPKLSEHVFLKAYIDEWEKYNLISGDANMFFETQFVGTTTLDVEHTEDTLALSMGIDKGITLKREAIATSTTTQFLSGKKQVSKAWKTTIKNNKAQTIQISILDQVPVSQTPEDIEVDIQQLSNGTHDPIKGEVEWRKTLSPYEFSTTELQYTVKFPKKMNLRVE